MKRNLIRIQQFLLNPKSACRNVLNLPLTGEIRTHTDFPTYQILHPLEQFHLPTHLSASQMAHSLEESARYQAAHSPNSSSHWNNQYAHRLSTVRKPPPTGGKHPRTGLQMSQNLQSLEELIRWQAYQHPNPSTHWRNLPAQAPPNCPDSSSEWRNGTFTCRVVSV